MFKTIKGWLVGAWLAFTAILAILLWFANAKKDKAVSDLKDIVNKGKEEKKEIEQKEVEQTIILEEKKEVVEQEYKEEIKALEETPDEKLIDRANSLFN